MKEINFYCIEEEVNNFLYNFLSKLVDKEKRVFIYSENTEKITNPGFKKVYRLIEKETHKAIADIIAFHDEVLDEEPNDDVNNEPNEEMPEEAENTIVVSVS